MFRRQGQQLQPADAAVTIVTASKLNDLFIISVSSSSSPGNTAWGSLRRMSDPDIHRRDVDFAPLTSQQANGRWPAPSFAAKSTNWLLVPGGRAVGQGTLHHPQ